jgi:hypothetical protein
MNKWFIELFQDDGKADIGKICVALIVLACITWISYIMFKTHDLHQADLGGISALITASGGVHFGINKIDNIVAAWKGNNPGGK